MRPLILAAVFAFLVFLPARVVAHDGKAHPTLFVNGAWFDGDRFVRRNVYCVDGLIASTQSGAAQDTIDLAGKYVVPAYADAHTHLVSDTSGISRSLRRLLAAGILYLKNPNNPGSQVAAVRAELNRAHTLDATFANGGLTSTGGHPAQIYESGHGSTAASAAPRWADDAYVTVDDEAQLAAKWPRIVAAKPDFIKVYLERSQHHDSRRQDAAFYGRRGLDPRLVPAVVAKAHAAKLEVSVHVTSAADFRVAVMAGVDEINHLPLERIDDAIAREAARRGIRVVTTTVSHRPAEGVTDVDALHRANLEVLTRAGVRLALGTDHPTQSVVDEALNIRRIHGLDDLALFRLLTGATAQAIFPARRIGSLAPGSEASFLALDGDPLADFENLRRISLRVRRGIPLEVAPEKPSVAEALVAPLMKGDVAGALALHERMRREQPNAYDFGERALNGLGYRMIQHGQAKGALPLFERNAELFPDSPNAYDSLADGCLAAGDTARAVIAYQRVLEIVARSHGSPSEFHERLAQRAKEQLARLPSK
jgi:imidazolonepropionase-like amidohydrolase